MPARHACTSRPPSPHHHPQHHNPNPNIIIASVNRHHKYSTMAFGALSNALCYGLAIAASIGIFSLIITRRFIPSRPAPETPFISAQRQAVARKRINPLRYFDRRPISRRTHTWDLEANAGATRIPVRFDCKKLGGAWVRDSKQGFRETGAVTMPAKAHTIGSMDSVETCPLPYADGMRPAARSLGGEI